VAVFVFRRSPGLEVLLLERAGGGMVGEWCPVAGRCEAGERPRETALREVREETGLELGALAEPDTIWSFRERKRGPMTIYVYSAVVHPDAEVELNYEHTDHGWYEVERALELLPLAQQRRALHRVLRGGAAFRS
jgi:8-oxo-dGTP pyrophosphatase MutT (NUDIX family)